MSHTDLARRAGLLLGGLAVVGMTTTMAGCSKDKEKPAEPTKSSSSSEPSPSGSSPAPAPGGPSASPTEKATALTPGGPNSFTPSVKAPAAPTALPGNVVTGG